MVDATEGKRPSTEKETENDSQMVKSLVSDQFGFHWLRFGSRPPEFLFVSQCSQRHFITGGALLEDRMVALGCEDGRDARSILVNGHGSLSGTGHVFRLPGCWVKA